MSCSVLIADDDAMVRTMIANLCEDLHWEVDQAASGAEALQVMKQRPHQVFVVDVHMPPPSGVELAQEILCRETAPAILILTGYADVDHAVEAMKEGVYDYIRKDSVRAAELKQILLHAAEYHENLLRSQLAQRDRETAIQNIEDANREFQLILDLSSDLIFILNARTGAIVDCNATACEKLYYQRGELIRLTLKNIAHGKSVPPWEELLASLRTKKSLTLNQVLLSKKGISFSAEVSYAFVCLPTGEFVAVVARDVSVRLQAEADLYQARKKVEMHEAQLQAIVEGMDFGVAFTDATGSITEVNRSFVHLAKTPRPFLIGNSISKAVLELTGCKIASHLEELKAGTVQHEQSQQGEIDGAKVLVTLHPVFQTNRYQGVIVTVIDVSNLLSEQDNAVRLRLEQLEFCDRLSRGIRSSLKPLLEISGQLQSTSLNEQQQIEVGMIQDCGESISALICELEQRHSSQFSELDFS